MYAHIGMMVSGTIWANKLQGMVKKGAHCENIGLFDLCLVHLGIRSIVSKASDSGMVLEIKSIAPLHQYTMAMCTLVSHTLPARSIQESVEFRARFMDGLLVSEDKRRHLRQVSLYLCMYWGLLSPSISLCRNWSRATFLPLCTLLH